MAESPASTRLGYVVVLRLFYDTVYLVAAILASPYLAFKLATSARYRAGIFQRLGFGRRRRGTRPCLWLHGVSVGEVLAATKFVEEFEREFAHWDVVISSTTKAGVKVARDRFGKHRVIYYPLDFSFAVRSAIRRVRPAVFALMELEIWPNLLLSMDREGIPVVLLNGRISEKSFRGFRAWQHLLSEPLGRIDLYCVQDETYADRLRRLGVSPEKLVITGTMKFDTIVTEQADAVREQVARELGLDGASAILVGGSTHEPEEIALFDAYRSLRERIPGLRLVLAPRHTERVRDVALAIEARGGKCITRVERDQPVPRGDAVILVATMGELGRIYSVADVVFVGGSLIPHGGQNMMEPAGLGKAVVFGSYVDNFRESVDLLLRDVAAIQVSDETELVQALGDLLSDPARARDIGRRARSVVERNQGASRRNLDILRERLLEGAGGGSSAARPKPPTPASRAAPCAT
ncbi:MAG: 3-deoxy-D-manno-octulosonic acid transferase [Planctomycetes bacterium]|nr:3-deoxy-D-manno-octulosonic acid transferase [Planctomycetota bacterium]MBI3844588.1 3-deoxy-D-manno-octulosonic acid transferase [Planctomycetota bacterium]